MSQIVRVPETPSEAWAVLDSAVDSSIIGRDRHDPGMAIRFWATRDDSVRSFVESVDQERLAWVEEVFTLITEDWERARFYAQMLYALVLGSGHMLPPVEHERMLDFYREFKRLLRSER
jgi:hypothetical protein